MAVDYFPDQADLVSPSRSWAALTPSDDTDFTFIPKALHISAGEGTFVAVGEDDTAVAFYGKAGDYPPIRPKRINATDLTAGLTFVGLKA